jgi:sugar O-acyltransferase (sialic acid O-acetyltransferase NeuD family)
MPSTSLAMDVVIFGAGGLGREIYDTLLTINENRPAYTVHGFIDEIKAPGTVINGLAVLGGPEALEGMRGNVGVILGVALTEARRRLHLKYKEDFAFPNVIHPTAVVSSFATLGEAILIQSNCVVAANATIGDGTMMNAHSGIGHDARVGDYCSIMSYCDLAGGVVLGESSFVGTGAKVVPSTTIAPYCYLCAGAVVFKDVPAASKLMGNPARVIG